MHAPPPAFMSYQPSNFVTNCHKRHLYKNLRNLSKGVSKIAMVILLCIINERFSQFQNGFWSILIDFLKMNFDRKLV